MQDMRDAAGLVQDPLWGDPPPTYNQYHLWVSLLGEEEENSHKELYLDPSGQGPWLPTAPGLLSGHYCTACLWEVGIPKQSSVPLERTWEKVLFGTQGLPCH